MVNVDDERTQKESAPEVAGATTRAGGKPQGQGRTHPFQG